MQRVRKFLILCKDSPAGAKVSPDALAKASQCEGWHQAWDKAVQMMDACTSSHTADGTSVAIIDERASLVVAVFSQQNLESLEPVEKATKWRSVRVASGEGCWCNLNYSDYGWGWVSGAKREVPFRLRFFERHAESNPNSLLSRTWAMALEARDWIYGHERKIG